VESWGYQAEAVVLRMADLVQAAGVVGAAAAIVGLLYVVTWLRRGPGPARHRRRS